MASAQKDTSRFFYGYVIVFVSFALQVLGWGMFNSFGVFFKPIIAEFAWPRALMASAISFCIICYGMVGIL